MPRSAYLTPSSRVPRLKKMNKKQMPSNFRSLTNTTQEENMVQEPNLDTFVVCRAKDDVGLVQIGEVHVRKYISVVFVSSRPCFFIKVYTVRYCTTSKFDAYPQGYYVIELVCFVLPLRENNFAKS